MTDRVAKTWAYRVPRQGRSAATLERVFSSTERLLDEKPFDAITVAEIVREAGSSVGSFYTRFPNKDALLEALDERYKEEGLAMTRRLLADGTWREADLHAAVRFIVNAIIAYHRRKPGLIRTLILRARVSPTESTQGRSDALTESLYGAITEILNGKVSRPDRIPLGVLAVLTVIREVVLFPNGPAAGAEADIGMLSDELTAMFLSYVQ